MVEENKNKEEEGARETRVQRLSKKCGGTVKRSFVLISAIHVATIVIAGLYFHECPVEPDIPKYLLVMGILGVATKLVTLFRDFLIKYTKVNPILSIIMTAELTIFIIGSYYVYREYRPDYDPQSGDKYCNKTLYLFAFIYITVMYSLLLFFILVISCFIIAIVLLDKYGEERVIDAEDNTTEVPLEDEHSKQTL